MSAIEIGRPPRRLKPLVNVVYLLVAVLILGAGYYFSPRFEWHAPQIKITPDTDAIGLAPIEIDVTDRGTGLKSVSATLTVAGAEHVLASEQFGRPTMEKKFTVGLSAKLAGVKEGPAVVRVTARDRSWWRFFRGNETVLQKNVTIDVTPPTIELIADNPYVNFGGCGLIVYKVSPDTVATGIKIANDFFPGYKGQTKDPNAYIAFFAHPYNVPEDERAVLIATDKAGNTRQLRLAYTLKSVHYRKSTLKVTDDYILGKVASLLTDVGARQGSPKDIFIRVNRDLRKVNEAKIKSITQKSTASKLWNGVFTQLPNSKVEANFADFRTYIYHEEVIDKEYHLGYDLSVVKHDPVEAANSGKVAFTGDLGIYGNTVIIDHGLGLFTLYSHLSSIDVKPGEAIKKRQIIGKTGETGLALGDHLHFGVYLDGVAVVPKEWWDEKWLRDHIYQKLQSSEAAAGAEAEDEANVAPRRATRRRRSKL